MKKSNLFHFSQILLTVLLLAALCGCGSAPKSAGDAGNGPGSASAAGSVSNGGAASSAASSQPEGPAYTVAEDSPLAPLPMYEYDPFEDWWDLDNSAEMLLFTAEDGNGYDQYQEALKTAGFTLYAGNEIVGNRYDTWTGEGVNVTTMYCPALQSVRILAEDAGELPTREEDNLYTDAGVQNAIVEVSTDHDGAAKIGMCYLCRLCDGSFLIVDGGHNKEGCAKAIHDTLVKLAPDPDNIIIAAWFLTHGHSDHVGAFYAFTEAYGADVTLERVVYNYPTESSFVKSDTSVSHISKTAEHIQLCGALPVEAHPGQKFHIRDAEVEMLYTGDLFSMRDFYFMNNSSLAFTITLGGTRFMVLGDTGPLGSPILEKLYGEYLKSDFMQVAHHGLVGASKNLNSLIDADVVLWPSSDIGCRVNKGNGANEPLEEAEHLYAAGDRVTVIPLPFDPDKVEMWPAYER